MIFLYVCLTLSVIELETRLETWIGRNEINGVYPFHLQIVCVNIKLINCTWNEYTPLSTFLAIHVSNRVFNLTSLKCRANKYEYDHFERKKFCSPYLAQIFIRSSNQTKNTWFGQLVPIVSTVSLTTSAKTVIK
jgi:hypothetical protein